MNSYDFKEGSREPLPQDHKETERALGVGCSQRICYIPEEDDDIDDSDTLIDALTENSMMDHPELFDLVDVFGRSRRGGRREW